MIIRRDIYLKRLVNSKHNGMIKIVTGVRRCGKSFLLFKLFYDHLMNEGVATNHVIVIDLEDRRNKELRNPDALLAHIDSQIKDNNMHYVLLDEVQLVNEFEDVLNSYLKMPNVDVYVTGSNSRFLSKDVITAFRGRGFEIHISPLSFAEFYSVFNGSREEAFEEYLTHGGMPAVTLIPDDTGKQAYLKDLFVTTYLKDIVERYNIKNSPELGDLINVVASSIGGLINPTKIERTFNSILKKGLSRATISSYLNIMEEAFLVEKSLRYDIKGRKYIGTPAKYYFVDMGLRNARLNFRQHELSHLLENVIYNELRMRGFSVDVGVVMTNSKDVNGTSQRKQLEVDFVCNRGSKRYYIQSALHLPTPEKREQEMRSLRHIADNFKKIVITQDLVKPHQDDDGITIINVYDFLLNVELL